MNLDKIIVKFVLGKAEIEEQKALEDWKSESKENLDALKKTIKLNDASEGLRNYQQVDTDKAWTKVVQRIQPESKVFNMSSILKVAAVFIVLIASLFLIIPQTNHSDFIVTVHQSSDYKKIDLKDGSLIELDAESKLTELAFREVSIQGRAYFDVSPDKSHPFKVVTNHGELVVLGTEFNIFSTPSKSQIFVTEGSVKHFYLGKEYTLNVGDMIEIDGENIKLTTNPLTQVSAWKSKSLKFENENLKNVLETIANYYKIEINYQAELTNDKCKINTSFKEETIDQVLKELELLAGLKYKLVNNKIIVKSFKC